MNIQISYFIYKILNKQYIYFFYKQYFLENFIYIFTFQKTLLLICNLFKYNTFFRPIIFLELSAFDYSNNLINNNLINFTLVYCFFMFLLCLKFFLFFTGSEEEKVFTLSNFFNNLLWSEREISEMHNINFLEKSDSRHLLLDFSLNGSPMLKSYSIIGYTEILYNFILSLMHYIKLMTFESIKTNTVFDY